MIFMTVIVLIALPLWLDLHAHAAFREGTPCRLFRDAPPVSLLPGKWRAWVGYGFYRLPLDHPDDQTRFAFCVLLSGASTRTASMVYIGPHCNIGLCRTGDDSMLGSDVHLPGGLGQHRFGPLDAPIHQQPGTKVRVTLGSDYWLDQGTLVASEEGEQSVIGASAAMAKQLFAPVIAKGALGKAVDARAEPEATIGAETPRQDLVDITEWHDPHARGRAI